MAELGAPAIAAIVMSALVVGISKAGFGSGAGMLSVPLMAVAIGSRPMLGVLLPVLIVGDVFAVVHYLRARDGRNLRMLLGGCAGGVAGGALVLGWFRRLDSGERVLDGAVGGLCVLFVAAQAWLAFRRRRPVPDAAGEEPGGGTASAPVARAPDPPAGRSGPHLDVPAYPAGRADAGAYRPLAWHGVLAGLASGLASTLSHAAGPVIAVFLLAQRMDKRVFVGTTAWFFFGCNLMKVPVYLAGDRPVITGDTLSFLPWLAPLVVLGTLLGAWMNRRIPARAFNIVVYVLVFLTGAKLVAGAVG